MHRNYRVISVCPAGRMRYSRLLAAHLLAQRDVIDEHHWWINTDDMQDLAFFGKLAEDHPDFFKCIPLPRPEGYVRGKFQYHNSIHQFFPMARDADAIYVRFDDDIVWMAKDAVKNLVACRAANRHPFLVYGNIVNNAICDHLHERFGALLPSKHIHYSVKSHEDNHSLVHDPALAEEVHRQFLDAIANGCTGPWTMPNWVLWDHAQASVNCVSWFGADIGAFDIQYHEEYHLAVGIPRSLNRPNIICGDALVAHFAFGPQRAHMDRTHILEMYAAKAPISLQVGETLGHTAGLARVDFKS